MNDNDCNPAQPSRIKWGRIVSLAGALGLCVSFFLPQCVVQIFAPPRDVCVPIEAIEEFGFGVWSFGNPFILAILLPPVLGARAVPKVDSSRTAGRGLAWVQVLLCLLALSGGTGWIVYFIVMSAISPHYVLGSASMYPLAGVGFAGLVLAVFAMARSPLPRKAAVALFSFWVFHVTGFSFEICQENCRYLGSWLSIAACGALTIGAAIDWFQCRPSKETLR